MTLLFSKWLIMKGDKIWKSCQLGYGPKHHLSNSQSLPKHTFKFAPFRRAFRLYNPTPLSKTSKMGWSLHENYDSMVISR